VNTELKDLIAVLLLGTGMALSAAGMVLGTYRLVPVVVVVTIAGLAAGARRHRGQCAPQGHDWPGKAGGRPIRGVPGRALDHRRDARVTERPARADALVRKEEGVDTTQPDRRAVRREAPRWRRLCSGLAGLLRRRLVYSAVTGVVVALIMSVIVAVNHGGMTSAAAKARLMVTGGGNHESLTQVIAVGAPFWAVLITLVVYLIAAGVSWLRKRRAS
jgi:hypothetical protein